MRVAPFGSKRCRGFLPESMNMTTVCRLHPCVVERNLSVESLPVRRYQPSTLATVLEELPPRLVEHVERGFETRITLQLINQVLHPDRTAATLKQQSQTRLRNVTSGNVETMNRLPNTLTFSWRNMIFGFLSRRCNKNCGRVGQQTASFRQETCGAEEDGGHEQNRSPIFESLQLDTLSCFHVDTHVLFETRIGCEEPPTMMFQQIVFSFREEARVTRCHKQFSTTTFLLSSEITQLDRRPAGTLCKPFPTNVATKLQDCCSIPEKLSENLSSSKTCNVSNCSDAQ